MLPHGTRPSPLFVCPFAVLGPQGFMMPKIQGGYYLKARKIQESMIQRQPPHVREIWDWLLMNANHKDKKYNGFIVKRGQLFRTYQEIRDGLHWMIGYRKMMYNENHTKKAMKALRDNHMITTSKELGGVLITILNYDFYQNPKNYERTNEITNESTTKEPIKNHPLPDNNKNDKNVKECKNVNNTALQLSELLFSLMLKNNPKAKKPNIEKWSEHIDKLIRVDGRKPEEIEFVIQWTQQDDFEISNILSTQKLRKRFDQLWLKANKSKSNVRLNKNICALEDFINE